MYINVNISARFNNHICVLDAIFFKEDNCKENRIFFLNKCQLVQMCVWIWLADISTNVYFITGQKPLRV